MKYEKEKKSASPEKERNGRKEEKTLANAGSLSFIPLVPTGANSRASKSIKRTELTIASSLLKPSLLSCGSHPSKGASEAEHEVRHKNECPLIGQIRFLKSPLLYNVHPIHLNNWIHSWHAADFLCPGLMKCNRDSFF
jgi:hypothetical protein